MNKKPLPNSAKSNKTLKAEANKSSKANQSKESKNNKPMLDSEIDENINSNVVDVANSNSISATKPNKISNIYDEMFNEWNNFQDVKQHYQVFSAWLQQQQSVNLKTKQIEAEAMFRQVGITFTVYNDSAGNERTIPFDLIPRIISQKEWQTLEAGLVQRVTALNMFLHDIYSNQKIIKDGIIPKRYIFQNKQFTPEMIGIDIPNNIYSHIAGIDIIRTEEGKFFVLEDNLRVPSGVSYMLENRRMMMRLFPDLFSSYNTILPVAHYPDLLLKTLCESAPKSCEGKPTVVLLTPGMYNSAYFEHAFLAQQMGIHLVEGSDLFVKDHFVYMRTTQGPKRVDVIYRRIDDNYLDPLSFFDKSNLGIAGLMSVYRAGHVNIANAVGTGVADDKSIYPYVPKMIKYYLNEEPILHNVETYECGDDKQLDYVLNNLQHLVIKEIHGSGGYGMLIGPTSSKNEIQDFKFKLLANPSNYIAQPTLSLSSCPTLVDAGIAPRHIDLRPFVLSGKQINMVAGGLTRVALKDGSLVVNSSQGGGTKDTWVLGA
jgi:uncharacterized circularly permuted ATP-grasp superfamily protein